MILGAIAMTFILISTYTTFNTNITAISVNTDYLDWNNTFPAVSICLLRGKSTEMIRDIFPINPNDAKLELKKPYIKYMSFIKMVASYLYHNPTQNIEVFEPYCANENLTCGVNITLLREILSPKTCDEIIVGVNYMGTNYTCQELFKPFRTEIGLCFIANSLHSVYVHLFLYRPINTIKLFLKMV